MSLKINMLVLSPLESPPVECICVAYKWLFRSYNNQYPIQCIIRPEHEDTHSEQYYNVGNYYKYDNEALFWPLLYSSLSFAGTKFLCSEVIAPIRSEIDDISLYIINFEDLSNPQQNDSLASRFSKCK